MFCQWNNNYRPSTWSLLATALGRVLRTRIGMTLRISIPFQSILFNFTHTTLDPIAAGNRPKSSRMPGLELIDHSPRHPSPAAPIATASNLVLIDNYDSFTWNVYQYLVLEGATVTVYRNDEITLQELIAQEPTQLVVSPGPGHPETDSGISKDAISHFAGKIPVLGVCMGE